MAEVAVTTGGTAAVSPVPAEAFAVSPELASDAFRRLSQLQDVVGQMVRQAKVLGRSVPLGGGYAGEVGEFMARYGLDGDGSAVASLTRFGRELENLKTQITVALERYEREDEAAADGVDCKGGG
ncbi:hypothetical protein [Prauserella muralis]|uniref:Uncharacterized protein n=1 Tax=Prauserella muralis TaxID=588067 RepID=A0A2V4B3R4_9PSEU|nr:hypothetical protein [Prauserella muralis]PXY28028.1 hypothetical protein BAY60_16940 [Prauserella muralis]TWE22178.1 hypothetical protein FHX69_3412 [Prauserella muralis]